ncbi:MAG: carbohydrate-binding domain-containing protein [Janthinobacterium lividum]
MASQGILDLAGFKLTFDDEFNTFSSNGPSDPSNPSHSGTWDTTLSYGERKLNDEVEMYADPTVGTNPFLAGNGYLDIHAAPSLDLARSYGAPYTSGIITTNHSFSQLYGYFEMRAELPQGAGMWPAFWMLPQQHVWPPELDPLEGFGASGPDGNGGAYSFHNGQVEPGGGQGQWNDTNGANLYTQFNTFGVDWEPDTLTFYFNGVAYQTVATPASFDQPMYLLANLAVGGHWVGAPTGESADMLIDYIRAYSKNGANPAVVQQAISSPDGRGYNFYGATDANGAAALGGVDLPPAPPTAPPAPTPAPTGDQTVGQGPHDVALGISEDAYLGDAQFTVTIDGTQIGGVLSTSASHSAGAVQTFHVMSDFSTGRHGISVDFLNNSSGSGGDRNLFLDNATLDGSPIPGAQLNEYYGGQQWFTFVQGDLTTIQAAMPNITIGSGPDTVTLLVAEDPWQGDAQFTVAVDGVQIGGTQTATVLHGTGLDQAYQVHGAFGSGPHQVSMNFLNDAWGGSSATDRNLYLDGASYRGSVASAVSLAFLINGMQTATVGSASGPVTPPPPTPPAAFSITDTTVNTSEAAAGETYSGLVTSLRQQFIWSNPDGVAIASNVPDVFLHGGSGDDALTVTAGTNVVDGGGGSNFLVGADGSDGGTDTFFVDGRGGATTWSTVVNFHHGDNLTIWGFVPGVSTMPWTASDGAEGYKGATIHSELAGHGTGINDSATLAGMSIADVASKLTITTGNASGQAYLSIAYTG